MKLREYQEKAIQLLREEIKKGIKKPLLWLATGGGKGLIMSEIANNTIKNGKKILIVMRRTGLIHQTKKNFKKYHEINSSILMGTVKGLDRNSNCIICSIDTVRNRQKKSEYDFLKSFDVVLVDEAHDINSPTYQSFIEYIGEKIIIGLTATPFGNLKTWQSVINPIWPDQLRDMGFLSKVKIYAPNSIKTDNVKITKGDFNDSQLFENAKEMSIIGDIVETYKIYGKNLPAILFCINVEHSKLMVDKFNESGISAIHCDADSTEEERLSAIEKLISGEIKILSNVNIFSTGTDIPEAVVGIMARPTMSETLWVQQLGRLLRIHPSKQFAIILDHAGNTLRHGLPYDRREYSLASDNKQKKQIKEIKIKTCDKCLFVFSQFQSSCPECGNTNKIQTHNTKEKIGELIEIDQDNIARTNILNKLKEFKQTEKIKGWKPGAKYFKLFELFGDEIYKYTPAPQYVANIFNAICPLCKGRSLFLSEKKYKCMKCKTTYQVNNNKKIITGEQNEQTRNSHRF